MITDDNSGEVRLALFELVQGLFNGQFTAFVIGDQQVPLFFIQGGDDVFR